MVSCNVVCWKIRGELLHTGTGVNFIPLVVLALKYRDEILLGNSTPHRIP
jgi:hypothetical protein